MRRIRSFSLSLAGLGALALAPTLTSSCSEAGAQGGPPKIDVLLCDGETSVAVDGDRELTDADGRAISGALMSEWLRKNPGQTWKMSSAQDQPGKQDKPVQDPDAVIEERHTIQPPFDNRYLLGDGQKEGHAYGSFTERDLLIWEREAKKFVVDGARTFHNAKLLGSTIAVSCDMCHPDGSNTHPETYPKFQTQLGKVALLRDMINWCIEHPVRGPKLAADDPRMRALEAYILGQRKGKKLAYGKH